MCYLKKKTKKKISRLLSQSHFGQDWAWTFEFPTYRSNYLTRPNDFGNSEYLCIPVFLIAYNRRFDYKLFLILFYRM